MPLYKTKVIFVLEVCFVASCESKKAAEEAAYQEIQRSNLVDWELRKPESIIRIRKPEEIPKYWGNAIPWGDDGNHTCKELAK
jgi:hypothetical protein